MQIHMEMWKEPLASSSSYHDKRGNNSGITMGIVILGLCRDLLW